MLAAALLAAPPALAGPASADRIRPLVGERRSVFVEAGDTLLDIAVRERLGYEAIVRLNPDVDPWIPEPGTVVVLPTWFVLPDADEEGLVIDIAGMRLLDYTVEPMESFAIAIGDSADPTLLGEFRVGRKRTDPVWHVPESIRAEKPELPAEVPAGPDNPLGSRWISIGRTSYGIHGTNNAWSIGREATHGCVRLYESDVQRLFDRVREGTRIQIVYQPRRWGSDGRSLYFEADPDRYQLRPDALAQALALPRALGLLGQIDVEKVWRVLDEARGIPVRVGPAPPEDPDSATP